MPDLSMLWELGVAGVIGVAFLLTHLKSRRAPDLLRFMTVVLSAVAVVSAIDFARVTATADLSAIPGLEQHRLIMLLGAVAVVWLGVTELVKAFVLSLASKTSTTQQSQLQEAQDVGGSQPRDA